MLSHSAWPHRLSPSTARFLNVGGTTTLTLAQSEESGIEPGRVATISGSFGSFADREHYDTDLDSEPNDADIGRDLLSDQWRQFFDQYDLEGFGEIPWPDFLNAMSEQAFRQKVNTGKREILLEKFRTANTHAITFQDFVNVVCMKWMEKILPNLAVKGRL